MAPGRLMLPVICSRSPRSRRCRAGHERPFPRDAAGTDYSAIAINAPVDYHARDVQTQRSELTGHGLRDSAQAGLAAANAANVRRPPALLESRPTPRGRIGDSPRPLVTLILHSLIIANARGKLRIITACGIGGAPFTGSRQTLEYPFPRPDTQPDTSAKPQGSFIVEPEGVILNKSNLLTKGLAAQARRNDQRRLSVSRCRAHRFADRSTSGCIRDR